ncbi:MAG: hypothetical protein AAGJ50_12015, partial [Pseudomonadota bacterium]
IEVEFAELPTEYQAAALLAVLFGVDLSDRKTFKIPAPSEADPRPRRLHEIADLDTPMGFKGNYMIFPMKECTYITDYMMQDFIDDYLGVRDPDQAGNFTTEELLKRAEEIWHDASVPTDQKQALRDLIQDRLTRARVEDETISVPTGQLFIEALKGEHALLEDFKLRHRMLDVMKVNEELCEMRLENIRRAARLVADTPDLGDPDVDKLISVSGASNINTEV